MQTRSVWLSCQIIIRYVNYRVALVGETSIRFLSNLTHESIVAYPELS